MRMKTKYLLVTFAFIISTNSYAFCGATECNFGDMDSLISAAPTTSSDRRACAENELATAKKLIQVLPKLSPAEDKWLNEEIDSGDDHRKYRAFGSDEYALKEMRNDTQEFINLLKQIVVHNKNGESEEMVLWAELSYKLLYEAHLGYERKLEHLLKKKIITENDIDITTKGQGAEAIADICIANMQWFAARILRNIVTPNLMDK